MTASPQERVAPAPDEASGPRRRQLAVWRWGLLIVAVQGLVRAWQVLPASFWQDDFSYLLGARRQGLSADYLLWAYNGHLMPAGFAWNWALERSGLGWAGAAWSILLLQTVASLLLLAVLVTAFGRRLGVLVGLAVYCFSPLSAAAVTWWAAATQAVPLQIAMLLAAWGHLHWLRTRRLPWLLVALAGIVFGFAFWEKAVVVPAFVGLLTLLVLRGGWRQVLSQVVRLWPTWAAYAVVTGALAAIYLSRADIGGAQVQGFGDLFRMARRQVVDVFLVGLVGGPWAPNAADTTQWHLPSVAVRLIVVQVLALAVFAAWRLRRARAVAALGVLAAYLLIELAITATGRGYWGDAIALDPRYVTDALVVAAVVVAAALTPRSGEPGTTPDAGFEPGSIGRWLHQRRGWVTAAVIVALFNSSMVTLSTMTEQLHRHHVQEYAASVRSALSQRPGLVLYDSMVPANLMLPLFADGRNRVSSVLDAYDVHPRYNLPSTRMRILDEEGRPWPIRVAFPSTAIVDPDRGVGIDDCGLALSDGDEVRTALTRWVGRGEWVMRIAYFTDGRGELAITTMGESRPIGVRRGSRTVDLVVEGETAGVTVAAVEASDTICVTSVEIGLPIPDTERPAPELEAP